MKISTCDILTLLLAVSSFLVLPVSSFRVIAPFGRAVPPLLQSRIRISKKASPRLSSASVQASSSSSRTRTVLLNIFDSDGGGPLSDRESSDNAPPFQPPPDSLVVETSKSLKRVSWLSWWSQVILTTVSSVILFFARSVVGRNQAQFVLNNASPNFFLSGAGLVVSCTSIIWTWGNGARLSRRMTRKPTTRIQAATLLRRAIRIGVLLNLVGLLLNLVAAEQIVGSLAIKVMTNRPLGAQPGFLASGIAMEGLQPLDILVVQANTNSLLSNFCSLVCLLFLTDKLRNLDPPSTEENPRKNRKGWAQ